MGWHMGATFGLLGSVIVTAHAGYKAWKEGWPVLDTMQGKWTGYSFEKEEFDIKRPTATYTLVAGATATKLAIWTSYNDWTPTGANM